MDVIKRIVSTPLLYGYQLHITSVLGVAATTDGPEDFDLRWDSEELVTHIHTYTCTHVQNHIDSVRYGSFDS